jgi:hypothetical protein
VEENNFLENLPVPSPDKTVNDNLKAVVFQAPCYLIFPINTIVYLHYQVKPF